MERFFHRSAQQAVDAQVGGGINPAGMENRQGPLNSIYHFRKSPNLLVNRGISGIDAYPQIAQTAGGQFPGHGFKLGIKTGFIPALAKEKTVGAGAYIGNMAPASVIDEMTQVFIMQKRLAAGKGQSTKAAGCSPGDYFFRFLTAEPPARVSVVNVHGALGTSAIAVVGKLNYQLARTPSRTKA